MKWNIISNNLICTPSKWHVGNYLELKQFLKAKKDRCHSIFSPFIILLSMLSTYYQLIINSLYCCPCYQLSYIWDKAISVVLKLPLLRLGQLRQSSLRVCSSFFITMKVCRYNNNHCFDGPFMKAILQVSTKVEL